METESRLAVTRLDVPSIEDLAEDSSDTYVVMTLSRPLTSWEAQAIRDGRVMNVSFGRDDFHGTLEIPVPNVVESTVQIDERVRSILRDLRDQSKLVRDRAEIRHDALEKLAADGWQKLVADGQGD